VDKLKTRNIFGVEALSTGTFWGHGSPPEGDTYTIEDLDNIVVAAAEYPLQRPAKLGHDKGQKLIQQDGWPAAGWLENVRRVGNKLLVDIMNVPEKVALLIEAGAYRTRSPELIWNLPDSRDPSRIWPRVLTGLSFLGVDIPACSTIDDMVALYGAGDRAGLLRAYEVKEPAGDLHTYGLEDVELLEEEDGWTVRAGERVFVRGVSKEEAERLQSVVQAFAPAPARGMAIILPFDESASYEARLRKIDEALPRTSGEYWWARRTFPEFVVVEVSREDVPLGDTNRDAFAIPYTIDAAGVVMIAGRTEWVPVTSVEVFDLAYAAATGDAEEDDLVSKFSALMEQMEGLIRGKAGAPRLRMWLSEASQGLSSIARKAASRAAGATQAEGPVPATAKVNQQKGGQEMPFDKKEVCMALGLPEVTEDGVVLERVRELSKPQAPDVKLYVARDSQEYTDLTARAEKGDAAEAKVYEMERNAVLDPAVGTKFLPESLEQWQKDYAENPALVKRTLAMLPDLGILGERGTAGGGNEPAAPPADRKGLADRAKKYLADHKTEVHAYVKAHPEDELTPYEAAVLMVQGD
jgi:hypothetical protein